MTNPTHIRIWRQPSGTLLAEGQKSQGITPSEGNYYIATFWTLDDPQSLALKKRYSDAYGLAGMVLW
jgi:hypothetical protein